MSDAGRGLPLLSGPPPPMEGQEQPACRKCNKEFNMIFARSRRCNHCGYSYCHSCSDYQAMMPRTGTEQGYDLMNVCSFCIEFLQITAAGRQQLKAMPLQKLKKYLTAYNIKSDRIVEKDDLIDAIISARGPNGCLPAANENYYRKFSVPNRASGRPRGLFSRQQCQSQNGQSQQAPPPPPPQSTRPDFARPDLVPDHPPPTPPRPTTESMSHSHAQAHAHAQAQAQEQARQTHAQAHAQAQQQHTYGAPNYPPPPPQQQQQHYAPYGSMPQQYPNYVPPPQRPVDPSRTPGYPGYNAQNYGPPPAPHYSRPPPQHAPHPTYYPQYQAPPPQPPHASRPQYQAPPPRPSTTRPASQAPPASSAPSRPRTVSTSPPPTLDQLLNMTHQAIGSLPISSLKAILFNNHVHAGQVLEKSELVKKVLTLIADEKADRERQRQIEEREEMERVQRQMELHEAAEREREAAAAARANTSTSSGTAAAESGSASNENEDGQQGDASGDHAHTEPAPSTSPPKSTPVAPKTMGSASTLERTGLCVICQDEEANIAIVDCGHMAMCRGCSDLVMASSKECPLCRTRIVTEARLLRIFKT